MMMMAVAITSAVSLSSCSDDDDDENVSLSKFTVDPAATTLTPGDTLNVKVQFFPENVSDKSVVWTTSDPEVVTVAEGMVIAVKPRQP